MPSSPVYPAPGSIGSKVMRVMIGAHAAVYKLSKGRIGGHIGDAHIVLVESVGRKSGQKRTTPLNALPQGNDLVVVASAGGSDHMPAWWLNLQAAPHAHVIDGDEHRAVVAREATEQERAELWPKLVAMYSDYDVYQTRTTRKIPVVILSPDA